MAAAMNRRQAGPCEIVTREPDPDDPVAAMTPSPLVAGGIPLGPTHWRGRIPRRTFCTKSPPAQRTTEAPLNTRIIVAAFSALACACTADAQTTSERSEGRLGDLDALVRWVGAEASFSDSARRHALARIDSIRAAGPADDDAAFWLQVASVVGLADNGHSNMDRRPIAEWGLLPIRLYWFADGLYVVRARSDHAGLVGARVDSVGGVSVDDLVTRLGVYHGGTDDRLRHHFVTEFLIAPRVMHAAGISDRPDALTLSVRRDDGTRDRVTVPVEDPSRRPSRTAPWVRLLPQPIAGEDGWVVAAPSAESLPVAFRDADRPFRYLELEPGIAYIQLRSNIDRNGIVLRDWSRSTLEALREARPRAIILDNRFNGGGDLNRAAALALALPEIVPADGGVYVLVSNATFSAGIYTSYFPESVDPERTLILGEHVGDRERFWAESPGSFTLPDSRFTMGHTSQMHDVGAGCAIRGTCHLAGRGRIDIAIGSLEPEVPVPTTFEDFRSGRDPVLEEALRRARD